MANFGYEAVDEKGKSKKGSIESESIEKARQELVSKGLIVTSIKEQGALTQDINLNFGGKPKPRDMGAFCRQFVSMTRAGVTIIEALKMLEEQTENKKLCDAIRNTRISVEKGETLAASLAESPKIFPELMIHMVSAGEAAGKLDVAIERMADQFEKSEKARAMVKKAMIYPIVVTVVALAVVVLMLVKIIPSYTSMFADLGTDLPAITKAVVAASDFIIANWLILAIGIGAVVFAIVYFARTDAGKHFFGKLTIKIPVVKNLTVKSAASMMSRTLSTLLASGVPLPEAVGIVSNTMTNVWFKEAMLDAKDQIVIGMPLSRPLEDCGLFPPMVYHMTKIGEEAGNVESMLEKMADYYDEEVENATQSLTALMEPMIILVLCAIVCVLLAAIMSPMLSMYDAFDSM